MIPTSDFYGSCSFKRRETSWPWPGGSGSTGTPSTSGFERFAAFSTATGFESVMTAECAVSMLHVSIEIRGIGGVWKYPNPIGLFVFPRVCWRRSCEPGSLELSGVFFSGSFAIPMAGTATRLHLAGIASLGSFRRTGEEWSEQAISYYGLRFCKCRMGD